jgi:outer membrane protein assembly factor BamB
MMRARDIGPAARVGAVAVVVLAAVVGLQVAPVVGLFSDAADTDGIASAAAGDEEWTFTTGNNVYSSPTVVDGTVYVGSTDGNLYALDASSGSQQWSFTAGGKIRSSATVVVGTV